jgi:hypothetical protein
MVFFLFIICVKADNPERHNNFVSHYEMMTEMQSVSGNIAIIDFIQTPFLLKSLVTLRDNTGFTLFHQNFKLTADNNRISQQYNLLQKTVLSPVPVSSCRFYYHLFPLDSNEPPLLG